MLVFAIRLLEGVFVLGAIGCVLVFVLTAIDDIRAGVEPALVSRRGDQNSEPGCCRRRQREALGTASEYRLPFDESWPLHQKTQRRKPRLFLDLYRGNRVHTLESIFGIR